MTLPKPVVLGAVLATLWSASAQDVGSVLSSATNDLAKALTDLSALRAEIERERLPLAQQVTDLEQKLLERRADLARSQRSQDNQLVELNALKNEVRQKADETKFVDSLLSEYARAFRSRLIFIEEPRYEGLFGTIEKAAATVDVVPAERFSQRATLLTTSLKRAEEALGGVLLEGKALDGRGRLVAGKVALLGPVAMFADSGGTAAGVLQQELNKADPTVAFTGPTHAQAAQALVTTGSGHILLDATLGNAFKLAALDESLYARLAKGGLIMIPLLALGAAAIGLALVKWVQLSRVRVATERDLQAVLKHLGRHERDKALAHARRIRGPAGVLLAAAVEHAQEKKEYIEEVLYEKMLGARTVLERGLAFLALSATTGPLLGLLGTVMGMIATFKMISSFGGGDPKQLAAGISEALICTATGMAIAIPSLLFHAFLSRKAKGIIGSLEQTAVGFVNGVPQDEKRDFAMLNIE